MTEHVLKILVIEDDFLVAQKLANEIRARGDEVVGPFADASDAIERLDSVQAAILDVRVHDGTTFPVADTLINSGIPFVFLTAYDRRHIPHRFHGHRIYSKPSNAMPLLDSLHRDHDLGQRHCGDDMEAVVMQVLDRARVIIRCECDGRCERREQPQRRDRDARGGPRKRRRRRRGLGRCGRAVDSALERELV